MGRTKKMVFRHEEDLDVDGRSEHDVRELTDEDLRVVGGGNMQESWQPLHPEGQTAFTLVGDDGPRNTAQFPPFSRRKKRS